MERCDDTRRILGYCRDALDEIKKQKPTGATSDRRWASLMALLRTAGLTLEREASIWWNREMKRPNAGVKERDPKKNWKPDIFGKFIWTDSNLFLHKGKSATAQSADVFLQGASAQARAAGEPLRPVPPPKPARPTEIHYHINTGTYANRNALDVAGEAIRWLEQQIDGAEK